MLCQYLSSLLLLLSVFSHLSLGRVAAGAVEGSSACTEGRGPKGAGTEAKSRGHIDYELVYGGLEGGVVVKDGSTGGSSQKAVISSPSRTRGTSPAVAPIGDPFGPDVIYRRKFTEGQAKVQYDDRVKYT